MNILFDELNNFFCKYPKLHPVFKNCYEILFSSNPKVFSFRKFLQNNFYKIQVIKIVFTPICVRNWKQTFSVDFYTISTKVLLCSLRGKSNIYTLYLLDITYRCAVNILFIIYWNVYFLLIDFIFWSIFIDDNRGQGRRWVDLLRETFVL